MGRKPEIVLGDVPVEGAEHRGSAESAASVAAPMTADEDERARRVLARGVEIQLGEVVVTPELDSSHLRPRILRPDDERDRIPPGPPRPTNEEDARSRRSRQPAVDGFVGDPGQSSMVATSRPHAPETSMSKNRSAVDAVAASLSSAAAERSEHRSVELTSPRDRTR